MSEALKPTCDRKTKFWQNQKNTFGLLPGKDGTCPGCTTGPKGCWHLAPGRRTHTCYVDALMQCYTGIRGVLEHNTRLLREADIAAKIRLLDAEFARFEADEAKHHVATGEPERLIYRIHWSGDMFDADYAKALGMAMTKHPRISFWSYTRSFDLLEHVVTVPNLVQYLSLDPENVDQGLLAYERFNGPDNPRLQLCYMSPYDDSADVMEPTALKIEARTRIRSMLNSGVVQNAWNKPTLTACPVDTGKLELEFGCSKCGRCLTVGAGDVWFKC